MPIELLFGLPVGLAIVAAAFAAAVMASRLGTPIRFLAALVFIPLACFCLFGFAATFEPGDYHVVWRVLYAVVCFGCLVALARLVFVKRQHVDTEQD